MKRVALELDHYADADRGLAVAKIGEPDTAGSTAIRICCREVVCPGRAAAGASVLPGRTCISAGRGYAAAAGPIGHVGMPVSGLRPPCDVLFGHIMKRNRGVPHVGLVPGIGGEIGRARDGIGAIDGREQREIAARVGHLAAAERDGKLVLVEPNPVVKHPTQEGLLRPALATVASYATTVFTRLPD